MIAEQTPATLPASQVAATGVGSTVSILGSFIACGVFDRDPGDMLAKCYVESLVTAVGTALHLFPAFVRVRKTPTDRPTDAHPAVSLACDFSETPRDPGCVVTADVGSIDQVFFFLSFFDELTAAGPSGASLPGITPGCSGDSHGLGGTLEGFDEIPTAGRAGPS